MATEQQIWKPNPDLIQPLVDLGITFAAAKRGLYFTGSSSIDAAASWVFDHANDIDLDTPFEVELNPTGTSSTAADSDSEESENSGKAMIKMVFVVNSSLKMGIGKIASQVAHACLALYKKLQKNEGNIVNLMEEWESLGTAKIVLKGNDTVELMDIESTAKQEGIINYLVCDAGRTQIAPASVTVLGIFGHSSQIDKLTGHLSLL